MLRLYLSLAALVSLVPVAAESSSVLLTVQDEYAGNINGVYSVFTNMHYANKSTVIWGENGQPSVSVIVSFSESCGLYNCSNNCDDPVWYGDFNKLWGKVLAYCSLCAIFINSLLTFHKYLIYFLILGTHTCTHTLINV
jgi:hypothetical protein